MTNSHCRYCGMLLDNLRTEKNIIWYVWLLSCMFVLICVADLMRDIKILFGLLAIKRNSWWIYEDREPPISQRRDVLGLQLKV